MEAAVNLLKAEPDTRVPGTPLKLRKRDNKNPFAPWYIRFQLDRKAVLWSTKTCDLREAKQNARIYYENTRAKRFHLVDAMKSRSAVPTFREICKQYTELPLGVDAATRNKNLRGLRHVLAASGLTMEDKVDRLSRHVAFRFLSHCGEAGVPATTANSRMRAAKSVFSGRALMGYQPQLHTEAIDDFKRVPALPEDERLPDVPSAEVIAAAHEKLPATPELYRAFLLAAYAGLRSGEIIAARWSWIVDGILYVGGREFVAKSRKWRPIRLDPQVIAKLGTPGRPEDSIVGTSSPKVAVTRGLPTALRILGYATDHPVHGLRRWFGSNVATASGIWAASKALGHSSTGVTEKAYARQLTMPPAVTITVTPTP